MPHKTPDGVASVEWILMSPTFYLVKVFLSQLQCWFFTKTDGYSDSSNSGFFNLTHIDIVSRRLFCCWGLS